MIAPLPLPMNIRKKKINFTVSWFVIRDSCMVRISLKKLMHFLLWSRFEFNDFPLSTFGGFSFIVFIISSIYQHSAWCLSIFAFPYGIYGGRSLRIVPFALLDNVSLHYEHQTIAIFAKHKKIRKYLTFFGSYELIHCLAMRIV